MKFSRYNYLGISPKFGALLFNTRTRYFSSLNRDIYHVLTKCKMSETIDINDVPLSVDVKNQLIRAKVFVDDNEDEDFYNIKKFMRYQQTFSQDSVGLVLVPTFSCNFKCPYCYESNLPTATMSEYVIDGIINFIKIKGQKKIDLCWHGGEPLLAFDKIRSFLDKIAQESDLYLQFHAMVSNGYLLDDEKCRILNDHSLNQIQITIDGDRNIHNASRIHKSGAPTYDTILHNVENVFKYVPECHVIIRVNLHQDNQMSFPALYNELKNRWNGQKFSIDMVFVDELNSTCKVACLEAQNKATYIKELYEKYGISDVKFSTQARIGGCTATYINSFVIGPSGEIYKCWVDVGKKDRIVSNIFNGKTSPYLMASYSVGADMFSDEKCKNCFYMPICDGGCVVKRYDSKHTEKKYDPCPINEKEFLSLLELKYMKLTRKANQAI